MDKLAKRGDFKNAIKLLQYCIELYPQSDQAYAFLARAYINISDKESAKKYLEKALKINPNNKYASQIKKQFGLK